MNSRSAELRPMMLLGAAAVGVVVALLAFASDEVSIRAIGWLVAGPVVTTLVALNRSAITRWSAQSGIVAPRWQAVACVTLVVAGFVLSIFHAGFVALELS